MNEGKSEASHNCGHTQEARQILTSPLRETQRTCESETRRMIPHVPLHYAMNGPLAVDRISGNYRQNSVALIVAVPHHSHRG